LKLFAEIKYRLGKLLLPSLLIFVLFYTYYQMLTGERGLLVWYSLSGQIEDFQLQNRALAEQLASLELKIKRLSEETLDADYVDELTRRNMPFMQTNEKMIFLQK